MPKAQRVYNRLGRPAGIVIADRGDPGRDGSARVTLAPQAGRDRIEFCRATPDGEGLVGAMGLSVSQRLLQDHRRLRSHYNVSGMATKPED